jgi:hypothetical protein
MFLQHLKQKIFHQRLEIKKIRIAIVIKKWRKKDSLTRIKLAVSDGSAFIEEYLYRSQSSGIGGAELLST